MNPPNFADLKGVVVAMMNHLHERRSGPTTEMEFRFPVDPIRVGRASGLLINGTSALFWLQAIPKEALRPADQLRPWSDEDWAYLVADVDSKSEKGARQRLLYPSDDLYCEVIVVCSDQMAAIKEVVSHSYRVPLMQKFLGGLRQAGESGDSKSQ